MIITYEQFKKCIKSIIDQYKYIDKIYDATDGMINLWENEKLTTYNALYDLLRDLTNDKNDWIEYWLYDCECGKRKDFCDSVSDKDGNKIPFTTTKDLWDILVMNDKKGDIK